MANKKLWVGMLVMVLVFGMAVIGCDNGTTNGNDGGGGNITITGIPATYNGNWAFFMGFSETYEIVGFASVNMQTEVVTLVQISGGSVTLPAWEFDANDNFVRFSGNATTDGVLFISSARTVTDDTLEANIISGRFWETVVFSGGNVPLIRSAPFFVLVPQHGAARQRSAGKGADADRIQYEMEFSHRQAVDFGQFEIRGVENVGRIGALHQVSGLAIHIQVG